MMFSMQQGGTKLPTLKTGPWPCAKGAVPNPLSIATARCSGAAGLSKVPCNTPGTGVHGHAWVIKKDSPWNERTGASDHSTIVAAMLSEPELEITGTNDMLQLMAHSIKMQPHLLCNHPKEETKDKIIKWFGAELFVDMHKDGILPAETTPSKMLEHLAETHARPSHCWRLTEQVEKLHNSDCNKKMTVKKHFMTLQEACKDAALLEQLFTKKQTMNKAATQFIAAHRREAEKAEQTWNKKPIGDQTWTNFKKFCEEEIHAWSLIEPNGNEVDALEAELQSVQGDADALQAENHKCQQENTSLWTQQPQIQQAL